MKILLCSVSQIIVCNDGGYSKQMHYLINICKEYGMDIYYLNHKCKISNGEPLTTRYTYDELVDVYKQLGHKPLKENNNLKDIHYYIIQHEENILHIDDVNKVITQNNIDLFFYLGDPFVFHINENKEIAARSFCWYPCHNYPINKLDKKGLNYFTEIVSLSPSIKLVLEDMYPEKRIHYLPHVATRVGDKTKISKADIRKKWNISDDKYIVLIIAQLNDVHHNNRKSIDTQLLAFKEHHRKHPNSFLFLHTKSYDVDLTAMQNMMKAIDLPPDSYYWNNNVSFNNDDIEEMYIFSDVLLNCTKAEGFGVPIVEAQLFELPVITNNFLSMAEHNFQNNVIECSSDTLNYSLEGRWVITSTENLIKKMEEIYRLSYDSNDSTMRNRLKSARCITEKLTSYNTIKENLYKILFDNINK
jgi:hypothetical protein